MSILQLSTYQQLQDLPSRHHCYHILTQVFGMGLAPFYKCTVITHWPKPINKAHYPEQREVCTIKSSWINESWRHICSWGGNFILLNCAHERPFDFHVIWVGKQVALEATDNNLVATEKATLGWIWHSARQGRDMGRAVSLVSPELLGQAIPVTP